MQLFLEELALLVSDTAIDGAALASLLAVSPAPANTPSHRTPKLVDEYLANPGAALSLPLRDEAWREVVVSHLKTLSAFTANDAAAVCEEQMNVAQAFVRLFSATSNYRSSLPLLYRILQDLWYWAKQVCAAVCTSLCTPFIGVMAGGRRKVDGGGCKARQPRLHCMHHRSLPDGKVTQVGHASCGHASLSHLLSCTTVVSSQTIFTSSIVAGPAEPMHKSAPSRRCRRAARRLSRKRSLCVCLLPRPLPPAARSIRGGRSLPVACLASALLLPQSPWLRNSCQAPSRPPLLDSRRHHESRSEAAKHASRRRWRAVHESR